MSSGIYKDPEKRKEYFRKRYEENREEILEQSRQRRMDSRKYIVGQCMKSVRKLKKEIGEYNCNRVLDELEKIKE